MYLIYCRKNATRVVFLRDKQLYVRGDFLTPQKSSTSKIVCVKKSIGGKCNFCSAGSCMKLEKMQRVCKWKIIVLSSPFLKYNLWYVLTQFWVHICFTHSKEMQPKKEGEQIYERLWCLVQSIKVYWLNWCRICTIQLTHMDISFDMMISAT